MREQIIALAALWQVDLVIVEDTSSGMGLIELLKEQSGLNVVARRPDADNETRMSRQPAGLLEERGIHGLHSVQWPHG